ncbi:MAG: hypothetical protein DWQ34_27315 [Planctomycetota bacterium]|nr:MAG: hypothetical protein DWQ34_27315 [Planctomycetota bacterium]REJ95111.1 MAG: hypothetical protein DWQ29_02240 [Planctomycetota bacterium]REK26110.1 MAG: hypothetical protein DWQ41_10665 [Planctomycetota bacterium]REK27098.1 MAG: hypothetical protein DWQ45_26580 [Planctomycetota bacterium]
MLNAVTIEVGTPDELARLRLPAAVDRRLQELLDRQDSGAELTAGERSEAEGLVELAETLSLLRLRVQNAGASTDDME